MSEECDGTDMQECTCHECGSRFSVPVIVYCPNGHRAFWDYDSWRRASAAKERRILVLESKPDHTEAVRTLRAACQMSLTSFESMWGRAISKDSKTGRVMEQLRAALEQTKEFAE
jgi:hypothetical protein